MFLAEQFEKRELPLTDMGKTIGEAINFFREGDFRSSIWDLLN